MNDFANVIDARSKRQLDALCTELDRTIHAQVAIVTVQTLGGISIEDYALNLSNQWGIGHREDNRGLLILLSIADHKYRIEVSCGFEALFPDERVAKIGKEMVPDLKVGDYGPCIAHLHKNSSVHCG